MKMSKRIVIGTSTALILALSGIALLAYTGNAAANGAATTHAQQVQDARQQLLDALAQIQALEKTQSAGGLAPDDPAMADAAARFTAASENYCQMAPDDQALC